MPRAMPVARRAAPAAMVMTMGAREWALGKEDVLPQEAAVPSAVWLVLSALSALSALAWLGVFDEEERGLWARGALVGFWRRVMRSM